MFTMLRLVTAVKSSSDSRRDRNRAATRAQIVAAARELLVAGGIEAVTVRAIAAELGMTAPALYRYFDSREALLSELIDALYDELADALDRGPRRRAARGLADRFMSTSFCFRQWALGHRAEFGLLFGAPLPGVGGRLAERPASEDRGARFGQVWLELFVQLWQENPPAIPDSGADPREPARTVAPPSTRRSAKSSRSGSSSFTWRPGCSSTARWPPRRSAT